MKVEIHDGSDFVAIEVMDYENAAAENIDDANWLLCYVTLKASVFSGRYRTSFTTEDFAKFHRELASAVERLDGTATFETIEDALRISVEIKPNGEATITGVATTMDMPRTSLSFSFVSDQSCLAQTCSQLKSILRTFPVKTA
jgi:hypothetical protein